MIKYTNEQINFLKENVPNMTFKEVTNLFNEKFNTNKKVTAIKVYCNQILHINSHPMKRYIAMGNHHRLPIGSERIDKDGIVSIKISNDFRKHGDNWVHKHRLIYEQHYGPIPKDMYVIFLDGDKTNMSISNLALAHRNTIRCVAHDNLYGIHPEVTKAAVALYDARLILLQEEQNE